MKRFDSINVIPLIDVMLVLLAIVLTTASFIVHDSMKLDLPTTENTQSYQPSSQKSIQLSLNKEGKLFFDKTEITLKAFKLKASVLDPKEAIVMQIDQATPFGDFVKIVDILKHHHLNNLTFLTDKAK